MRRLNDDCGAISVVVALVLVVLLGFGALVVDVGQIYFETRQLQNGADAAAIAIAQGCAAGEPCTDTAAGPVAVSYAGANSNDSASSAVPQIPGLDGSNSVTVTTSTLRPGGGSSLSYILASAIGIASDDTFTRQATALWGGVSSASTLPLTFSKCEWDVLTGGNPSNLPTAARTIYFHSSQTAKDINTCGGPANQDHPGGFGWLSAGSACKTTYSLVQVNTSPGNSVPSGCSEQYFRDMIGGNPVLVPIFGSVAGNGNNAKYTIVGFAALEVHGYRFSGSQYNETPGNVPCSGDDRCIRGRFVAYYDLGSEPTTGAPDYGVSGVRLSR